MASPAHAVTEIEVVSEGDIILELSDCSETTRFTVASMVLCIASPVMRAMIGPKSGFRERVEFMRHDPAANGGNLFALELPEEESVEAFGIILHAIHLQYDKVPREVDFGLLVKLAVVCDKYDMAKSVRPLVDGWALRTESSAVKYWYDTGLPPRFPRRGAFADWLFVAWVFGRETTFCKISEGLMFQTRGKDTKDWKDRFLEDSLGGQLWILHMPDVVIG
jgi:hypothetical protein